MEKKNIVLVVPTIRKDSFMAFVERWQAVGLFEHVDLIVMEDNPTRTFPMPLEAELKCRITHLCWEDIEEDLGDKSWIIPRRSDTVRSYAYYVAWSMEYPFILTLDDDCYPCTEADGLMYDGAGFLNSHLERLQGQTKWFNTLTSVKPRGIPFYNTGRGPGAIVNHGLWTNVLDYDAPFQLANPIPEKFSFDSRVVPAGQYFPMCGMNVMWRREATPLMYHLLMGQEKHGFEIVDDKREPILKKLPFDRFGDIWCGIFMKRIADHYDLLVSTGMPYIRHERASNPFTNLKKEANGIEVNEKLWEWVDSWLPTLQFGGHVDVPTKLVKSYAELGQWIAMYKEFPEHEQYFKKLGNAMAVWASLFAPLGFLEKFDVKVER